MNEAIKSDLLRVLNEMKAPIINIRLDIDLLECGVTKDSSEFCFEVLKRNINRINIAIDEIRSLLTNEKVDLTMLMENKPN